jgi:hypothetical protein
MENILFLVFILLRFILDGVVEMRFIPIKLIVKIIFVLGIKVENILLKEEIY